MCHEHEPDAGIDCMTLMHDQRPELSKGGVEIFQEKKEKEK